MKTITCHATKTGWFYFAKAVLLFKTFTGIKFSPDSKFADFMKSRKYVKITTVEEYNYK